MIPDFMLPFIGKFHIYKRPPRKKGYYTKFHHMKESKVCLLCKFYVFDICLRSIDSPIWHCKHGFSPYVDDLGETCFDLCVFNESPRQLFLFDSSYF